MSAARDQVDPSGSRDPTEANDHPPAVPGRGETEAPSGTRQRGVVMADVARLAGVSQMTVSRVINDSASVKPATRDKVEAAMQRLNYRPNVAARALATGRSRILGVVAFNTTLFGPASTLFGIEEAARESGYFVSVVSMRSLDHAAVSDAVDHLRNQAVDGIAVMAPNATAVEALAAIPDDMPAVAVQGGSEGPIPMVANDQEAGARRATQHLLSLGHDTVWHVSGPRDWIEARARERAWRRTLDDAGCEVPPVLVGDWSARSGYELGGQLLREDGATAVFAANDHMALGICRAVREAGLRLPEDVSLVGFDDIPEAAFFAPPLTTVRQDFAEVGSTSLRMLVDQVEGTPRDLPSRVVDTELVLRDSTAPPRPAP